MLIRQHKPRNLILHGFEAVRDIRNNEVRKFVSIDLQVGSKADIPKRGLITALGNIIGLAESNTWVQNANFTAHHMLKNSPRTLTFHQGNELTIMPGGYHIRNKEQREHSITFLQRVQQIMGFETQTTIALLRSQWCALD